MNIGCVIYDKDVQSGSLTATWFFEDNKKVKGTGIATGVPGKNYSGKYVIVYIDEYGNKSNKYDLQINNDNGFYTLKWFLNQELKYVGTGMIQGKFLIAGWKKYKKLPGQ